MCDDPHCAHHRTHSNRWPIGRAEHGGDGAAFHTTSNEYPNLSAQLHAYYGITYLTGDVHSDDAHGAAEWRDQHSDTCYADDYPDSLRSDLAAEQPRTDAFVRAAVGKPGPQHVAADDWRDRLAQLHAHECYCGDIDAHRTRNGFVGAVSGRHARVHGQ